MKYDFKFTQPNPQTVGTALKHFGVSRRLVTRLKRTELGITVNGKHAKTTDTIQQGDVISISTEDAKLLSPVCNTDVTAVYEDDSLIIFDKPPFMPVHPSIKHQTDTLGNCFAYRFPQLTFRPVNRLDRNTSGLCVVAKDAYSASCLQHSIGKTYYAVVCGNVTQGGTVSLPIAREQESIIKRCVRADGQPAVTHYTPVSHSKNGRYTLLKIKLETGRTHQIRVHLSHIGYALAGDDMYGGACDDINRQALHCGEIELIHPVTNERMRFCSQLPKDISELFK